MPDAEFCRNMDQEMIANRIRSLKNDELSALFVNVRAVYELLLNLKVGAKENETFN